MQYILLFRGADDVSVDEVGLTNPALFLRLSRYVLFDNCEFRCEGPLLSFCVGVFVTS
jgi:hypothetical protein